MIIFDLMCELEHHFEGWFRNSSEFEQQCSNGQLVCPICGIDEIRIKNHSKPTVDKIQIPAKESITEQIFISQLSITEEDLDIKALTNDFMNKLHDFVDEHFNNIGVDFTIRDVAAVEEIVDIREENTKAIGLTTKMTKKNKLN